MPINAEKKRMVNLGCGARYHADWINIDISAHSHKVIKHDLNKNIPLDSSSCDVVYHSAVLEHIRPSDAKVFLGECKRVLKPGGILRVGVPDLETMCQLYLTKLHAAANGDQSAAYDYDWLLLELFDQSVREESGGEMLAYLKQYPLVNEEFVFERIGEEGKKLVELLRYSSDNAKNSDYFTKKLSSISQFIASYLRNYISIIRKNILQLILGADAIKALTIGRFRLSGEIHQWVYDRYSLTRLLLAVGFRDPVKMKADTSHIPDWSSYNLDTLPDGTVIKPDLFYMEANKP